MRLRVPISEISGGDLWYIPTLSYIILYKFWMVIHDARTYPHIHKCVHIWDRIIVPKGTLRFILFSIKNTLFYGLGRYCSKIIEKILYKLCLQVKPFYHILAYTLCT